MQKSHSLHTCAACLLLHGLQMHLLPTKVHPPVLTTNGTDHQVYFIGMKTERIDICMTVDPNAEITFAPYLCSVFATAWAANAPAADKSSSSCVDHQWYRPPGVLHRYED